MTMKTYTREELAVVLENHSLWLRCGGAGVQANLYGANLCEA